MRSANVKVCVRVRPPQPREIQSGEFTGSLASHKNCVYLSKDARPVLISADGAFADAGIDAFSFDAVLGQESNQTDVYAAVNPVVKSVLDGVNATIFAYGQVHDRTALLFVRSNAQCVLCLRRPQVRPTLCPAHSTEATPEFAVVLRQPCSRKARRWE